MKAIYGLKNLKRLDKKSVITIGVFDGVHIGHQQIIKEAVRKARQKGLYSVVITFDPHPLDVLKPKSYPTILTGLHLKLHLVESLGVDIALVIRFTKEFARLSAGKFINDLLVNKLRTDTVIIGQGFRFGAGAKGDANYLKNEGKRNGFSVLVMPLLKTLDDQSISSTRLRNLIREGRLDEAKKILGHPVIISGQVVAGKGYGDLTGFHTANIKTTDKASVPKEGVYAGFALVNHINKKMPSVINIGPSPTFDVRQKRIEVHLLGYDKPLYDKELEVVLVARLRDIRKFANAGELSAQIEKDIQKAKKILY